MSQALIVWQQLVLECPQIASVKLSNFDTFKIKSSILFIQSPYNTFPCKSNEFYVKTFSRSLSLVSADDLMVLVSS